MILQASHEMTDFSAIRVSAGEFCRQASGFEVQWVEMRNKIRLLPKLKSILRTAGALL
jgi:hypothetical protein